MAELTCQHLLDGVTTRTPMIHTADGVFSAISATSERAFPSPLLLDQTPPKFPLSGHADSGRTFIINIFPVGIMAVEEDHLMLGLFTPDGADRTRIEEDFYFPTEAMADTWAQAREERIQVWKDVTPQDENFVAGVQSNLAARDIAGMRTRFSPAWEGAVQHFQQNVAAAMA